MDRNKMLWMQHLTMVTLVFLVRDVTSFEFGSFNTHDFMPTAMHGCPEGQIYCFLTERCVTVDTGTCPSPPNCGPDEELQWNPDGYEECVQSTTTHWTYCPDGQIYCFLTERCVTVETGTCPPPPNCGPDEELQWNPAGYQECVKNAHWTYCPVGQVYCLMRGICVDLEGSCVDPMCGHEQVKCNIGGNMQCVQDYECRYAEVKLHIDIDYDVLFVSDHDTVVTMLLGQFATALGVSDTELWDWHTYSGSVYLVFRAPESTMATLESWMYSVMPQMLTDQYGQPLTINWSSSHVSVMSGGDHHTCDNNECTDTGCYPGQILDWSEGFPQCLPGDMGPGACGYGEVFCIQKGQCIREDGTCRDPECPYKYMLCYHDGRLQCVDHDQCHTYPITFKCMDYVYYNGKYILATGPGGTSCPHGQVYCFMSSMCVTPEGSCETTNACSENEREQWNPDGGYWECVPDGDGSSDCPPDQVYCFMTRRCVTPEGACSTDNYWNSCPDQEMMCFPNTSLAYCSTECYIYPLTVTFKLDGDFSSIETDIQGFQDALQDTIKTMLGINFDDIQNMVVSPGSIIVEFDLMHVADMDVIVSNIQDYIDSGGSMQGMNAIPGSLTLTQQVDNGGGGDNYVSCPANEVYCFMTSRCVTPEGTCSTDNNWNSCPVHETNQWNQDGGFWECVPDGDSYSSCPPDQVYCFMTRRCVTPEGTCSTDNYWKNCPDHEINQWNPEGGFWECVPDGDSYGSCPPDQVYCFMTRRCVTPEGACSTDNYWNSCPGQEMTCFPNTSLAYCSSECYRDPLTVTFKLDGDFSAIETDIQGFLDALQDTIKTMLGINFDDIQNMVVSPGSIIVTFDLMPLADMDVIVRTIQDYIDSGGNMLGKNAIPGSLTLTEQVDNGGGGDNYVSCHANEVYCFMTSRCVTPEGTCSTDNYWTNCPGDEVYCFMTRRCVTPEGTCSTDNYWNSCPDQEMLCFPNITGLEHCSAECYTASVKVTFKLDGDFSTIEIDIQGFLDALQDTIKTMLGINFDGIQNMVVSPGSIIVEFDLMPLADMDVMIQSIQDYIDSGGSMLGRNAIPGSLMLSQQDTNGGGGSGSCASGEILCTDVSGTPFCSTTGQCDVQPSYDHYIIKIPLTSGESFMRTIAIAYTTMPDIDTFHSFIDNLKSQFVQGVVEEMLVKDVTALPGNADGDFMLVYAEVIMPANMFTTEQVLADVSNVALLTGDGRTLDIETEHVTVAKLNDNGETVLIIQEPVVKGTEYSFLIGDILPSEIDANMIPASLNIVCNTGVEVMNIDGVFAGTVTVNSASEITIKHSFDDIRTEGCQVTDANEQNADGMKIGFLALPNRLYQLATAVTIAPTVSEIVLTEDSPCISLQHDMFSMQFQGDGILDTFENWHLQMQDNNELWVSSVPAGHIIESILFEYHRFRLKVLANLRSTVAITDDTKFHDSRLKAKFRAIDGSLVESVLASRVLTNPETVGICVAKDYSGSFTLEITRDDVLSDPFLIPVNVANTNDAPHRKVSLDITNGIEQFSFPRVPEQGDPPLLDDQQFNVGELAAALYDDIDMDEGQKPGLAVLGYLNSDIAGVWAYSQGEDIWVDMPPAIVPGEEAVIDVTAILLHSDDLIRLTVDASDKMTPWTRRQAPRIAFTAWDMSNKDSAVLDPIIQLEACSVLNKENIGGFCVQDGQDAFSRHVIVLPLTRRGCDDILNSGNIAGVCGCGLHTGCEDCLGVPFGSASYDICGQCVTSEGKKLTEIDCTNLVCQTNHVEFCTSVTEAENEINSLCEVGEKINPAYDKSSPVCDALCIPEVDDAYVDACGVECGTDSCLDCEGVVNGIKVWNLCGSCKDPININEGCTSIGNIYPDMLYEWASVNVSLDVVPTLFTSDSPTIACTFMHNEISATGNVPVVTNSIYDADRNRITLTIDASSAVGEFVIECDTDQGTVTTADHHQILTIFGHPDITSVSPQEALITDLHEDTVVTLSGTGFVDTGVVYCMLPCTELDGACTGYMGVDGTFIDETSVTCPVWPFKKARRGYTYHPYVILDYPHMVDMNSLVSAVLFTVTMPTPQSTSATLDMHGCYEIVINFDQRISKASDHQCSNYFDASTVSTYSLAENEVRCKVSGRNLYIVYNTPIATDSVLTFKPDAIRHAEEQTTNTANFVTGSVTVLADSSGEGDPTVNIDKRISTIVGCKPVRMRTRIKNKGCWEPQITWTVTVQPDPGSQEVTDSLTILNTEAQQSAFAVTGDMLVDGVVYTVSMDWATGVHSGSDSIQLEKDTNLDAVLTVYVRDLVDADEQLILKAKFSTCLPTESQVDYSWSLSPTFTFSDDKQTRVSSVPAGSLQYDTEYILTCSATYMTDQTVTTTATFRTRPKPILAGILVSGQLLATLTREVRTDEDLVMECVNQADTSGVDSDITCTWSCKENLFVEDEFMACIEPSPEGFKPVQRTGQTVTVPASGRIRPPQWDLRQTWHLSMSSGVSAESVSIKRTFHYKQVPVELKSPEIRVKTSSFVITDTATSMEVHAKCRKATKYIWGSDNTDALELPISAVTKGQLERDIGYDEEMYIPCGIGLALDTQSLIAGLTYTLAIEGYNQNGNVYLTHRKELQIQVISIPVPGTLQVYSPDEDIKALSSPISISLDGWWDALDGTALQCNFFYKPEGSTDDDTRVKINALSNPLEQGIADFTLPTGVFKVEARCCNSFSKCARATSDTVLTVTAISPTQLVSVIEEDLIAIILHGGADDLLSLLLGIVQTVKDTILSEEEATQTQDVIVETSNDAINQVLKTAEGDPDSTLGALESTSRIAQENPDNIDDETQTAIQDSSSDVAKSKTGQTNDASRKKRSTTTSDPPEGLQESEAIILLEAFDSTVSEDSISSTEAIMYKGIIENIMLGLCQAYTGSEPWVAPAANVYVRAHRTHLAGQADTYIDVSCDNCSHVDHPAMVKYGNHLETMFSESWQCSSESTCNDVCVTSAQLNIDTITMTAANEILAPTRKSDIVILRFINPETYEDVDLVALTDPVEVEMTILEPVDTYTYDYKCMMWVSDAWSDAECTESSPTLDSETLMNTTICSCTSLGIIGLFQQAKPDPDQTSTSTTTTTTAAPVTAPPSKQLKSSTDFLDMRFTFNNDYDTSVTALGAFIESITSQIAAQANIQIDSIKNMRVERGSIIVLFELHKSGGATTLGQMAYTLESMFITDAMVFTSSSGSLTVLAGSFSYTEKTSSDDDDGKKDDTGNNMPYIIGGVLGGLVIIGAVIVIVVCVVKKNQKTFPIQEAQRQPPSNRDTNPPPAYALAPPPPYIYDPPTVTNKWMEDEVIDRKRKEPQMDDRPSSHDGSSFETKLASKESENLPHQPTPDGQ